MAGSDVTTVQQLLIAAGNNDPSIIGGGWGNHSRDALIAFRHAHHLPERNYVERDDACLFELAAAAQILVPLPNLLGMSGVMSLHQWFREMNTRYQKGPRTAAATVPCMGWTGAVASTTPFNGSTEGGARVR